MHSLYLDQKTASQPSSIKNAVRIDSGGQTPAVAVHELGAESNGRHHAKTIHSRCLAERSFFWFSAATFLFENGVSKELACVLEY